MYLVRFVSGDYSTALTQIDKKGTGAEVFGVWINKILNTAHSVIKGVCYEKR